MAVGRNAMQKKRKPNAAAGAASNRQSERVAAAASRTTAPMTAAESTPRTGIDQADSSAVSEKREDRSPGVSHENDGRVADARERGERRERILELVDRSRRVPQRPAENPGAQREDSEENRSRRCIEQPPARERGTDALPNRSLGPREQHEERQSRRNGRSLLGQKAGGVADEREEKSAPALRRSPIRSAARR